ncbi:Protein TAPT1 [Nymphon striatum]|nr:Protein TAPT1 [Nymphon striatum]
MDVHNNDGNIRKNQDHEDIRVGGLLSGAISKCKETQQSIKNGEDAHFSLPSYEKSENNSSFFEYLHSEMRRGYSPGNDEAHYSERRDKMYIFMTVPKDVEKVCILFLFRTLSEAYESVLADNQNDSLTAILPIINIMLTISPSTAQCERGFSAMNGLKTQYRTSLNQNSLSHLMRVKVDGPSVKDFNPTDSLVTWINSGKSTKHLKGHKLSGKRNPRPGPAVLADTSSSDGSVENSDTDYNDVVLQPAETCDILKGIILITGFMISVNFDTSVLYHVVKSQSVIKLYLIFNMLEVADRLVSSFGQDTLDVLYYTASETKTKKREYAAIMPHLFLVILYVSILLLWFSDISVFVELKGSVFKKFEKNNLFQMSCSDVRERIHYLVLLLFVIVQTMKAYAWKDEQFYTLICECFIVLACEFMVDWVKHGFITRFNEISSEVYKEYRVSLAYDLATSRQTNAFSHHSDLVSRRMGFTPFPLAIVLLKVFSQSISLDGTLAKINFALALLCLFLLKMGCSIYIFGKACEYIEEHQKHKNDKNEAEVKPEARSKSHPVSRKTSKDNLLNQSRAKSVPQTPSISNSASLTDISNPTNSLDQCAIFSNSTVSLNSVCLNDAVLEHESLPKNFETDSETRVIKDSCMSRGRANSTSAIRHRVSLVEDPLFYIADENNINNNVT